MMTFDSWKDVVKYLASKPCLTTIKVNPATLVHPLAIPGAYDSTGLPKFQTNDYRLTISGAVGLHIKDLGNVYSVHLDEISPEVSVWDHLKTDVPGMFIPIVALAFGAVLLFATWRTQYKWRWAIAGMILGGLAASAYVIFRPRPSTCINEKYDFSDVAAGMPLR